MGVHVIVYALISAFVQSERWRCQCPPVYVAAAVAWLRWTVRFVRLALKVVMLNDEDWGCKHTIHRTEYTEVPGHLPSAVHVSTSEQFGQQDCLFPNLDCHTGMDRFATSKSGGKYTKKGKSNQTTITGDINCNAYVLCQEIKASGIWYWWYYAVNLYNAYDINRFSYSK
jgi:hypothetical protein